MIILKDGKAIFRRNCNENINNNISIESATEQNAINDQPEQAIAAIEQVKKAKEVKKSPGRPKKK